ncbi:MAG: thiol:disulfide interchange protein DsbA/DsbL [bacterium]
MQRILYIMFTGLGIILSASCTHRQVAHNDISTSHSRATTLKSPYREGTNYMRVAPASQVKDSKVHITEFFLYSCPHCYALEPKMQNWLAKHKNIVFERIPAILGPEWVEQARFFYTAQKLGVLDSLHKVFFDSIHEQGKQYYNAIALRQFFISHGVSLNDFLSAYQSDEVKQNTNRARQLSVRYALRGVPAVIINHEWKTAPFYVHNQEEMFTVIEYLLNR